MHSILLVVEAPKEGRRLLDWQAVVNELRSRSTQTKGIEFLSAMPLRFSWAHACVNR